MSVDLRQDEDEPVVLFSKDGQEVRLTGERKRLWVERNARWDRAYTWRYRNLPPRYQDYEPDTLPILSPEYAEKVDMVRNWQEDPEDQCGLVLFGPSGTLKTGLAVSVGCELVMDGKAVAFRVFPSLLHQLQLSFKPDAPVRESELMSPLVERGMSVIVDDVGADNQKLRDWGRQKLGMIIDAAYANLNYLVLTTNLGLDELEALVGPKSWSRLFEMSLFVSFEGLPDVRQLMRPRDTD